MGTWVFSGTNSDSNPRSSAAIATSVTRSDVSVANIIAPIFTAASDVLLQKNDLLVSFFEA